MSSVHVARQGFITKSALPSVSRVRGTTSVADKDTVLLLNGNGTNGAQNNTFVASNFGTAGGQGNYSVFFDGTGDYLTNTSNDLKTAMNFGTGDFTIEAWVYFTSSGNNQGIIDSATSISTSALGQWYLYRDGSSKLQFGQHVGGAIATSTATLPTNSWTHVAVSRSGTSLKLFINGAEDGSATNSTNFNAAGSVQIGVVATPYYLTGYISNLRVLKGTAQYTAAFTPPTSELTAITNTSLLTCQGTVIRDASTNNFAITVNGDTKVATNTNIGPLAITRNGNTTQGTFTPFSQPAGRWSNYFDGTGDYLSATLTSQAPGTGSFTYECWINVANVASSRSIMNTRSGNTQDGFDMGINTSRQIGITYAFTVLFTSTATINLNTWHHIAVVRNGTTNWTVYLDGTSIGTFTNSTNFTSTTMFVGASAQAASPMLGYISNFRYVRDAVYTTNFTPPTAPLTAITNTQFLTSQDNRFRDASTNNFAITRNGDVRVTSFSPFAPTAAYDAGTNGGSGYFDGTGDRLALPADQTGLQLGNSDFTFEAWVYRLDTATDCIFQGQADLTTSAGSSYVFYVGTSNSEVYSGSTSYSVASPNPSPGQWAHIAWARTGGTYSSYLNGSRVGTIGTLSTNSINNGTNTNPPNIGAFNNNNNALTGYIASARLIKGSGGYDATQATITIPTAPLTAITNTSLLLNFTNAGIIDTAMDNVIETVGNAQIDTGTKKFGSGSLEFDGNGDYLRLQTSPDLEMGSGNFTWEFWINPNSVTGSAHLLAQQAASLVVQFGNAFSNQLLVFDGSNRVIGAVSTGTWTHIAIVRNNGTLQGYINGVATGSSWTNTSATTFTLSGAFVGIRWDSSSPYNGFIDDLRITKGVARYTANFTPPTSELALFGDVDNVVNNNVYGVYQLA